MTFIKLTTALKAITMGIALLSAPALLTACDSDTENAAEDVGENVDDAAENVGENVDDAAENVGENVDDAAETVEDTAEEVVE